MKKQGKIKRNVAVGAVGATILSMSVLSYSLWQKDVSNTEAIERLEAKNVSLIDENWLHKEAFQKTFAELEDVKYQVELMETDNKNLSEQKSKLLEQNKKYENDLKNKLNGKSYLQVKSLDIEATAYTQSEEEGTADGITFTETKVKDYWTVAVDPKVIPLGSLLYIESDSPYVGGIYKAEDIGGAIKGNKIDVFISDINKANDFGRQPVRVTVLKEMAK